MTPWTDCFVLEMSDQHHTTYLEKDKGNDHD